MSGPLFSFISVIVVGLLAVVLTGLGAAWIIPVLIVALLPLLASPVLRMFSGRAVSGPEPHGVPTTAQASYDPQFMPQQRG